MALVLIGFMGAGKTTAAGELAQALGVQALDSDELLAERFGHAVAREFELHGEAAFRESEEELVCELLAGAARASSADARTVIALGGGSVLSERVRERLAAHTTVLLDVAADTAWARAHGAARPLARERGQFAALHAERRGLYEGLADAILTEPARGGAARAAGALRALAAAPRGTRMLWASAACPSSSGEDAADGAGEYAVFVGRGLLAAENADVLAAAWPLDRARSRPFCVSDETVMGLYGDRVGELAGSVAIAPGESQKTLASAERVWQAMVDAGVTRGGHVLALGGGVVGDLAGFCAATYQRGVPVVHVPTTLVAQVDSAYGGKTGVDLPQAKNYVGAYHQPAGVLVDPDVLASLPAAELAAGWVEVAKTALIAGGELWETVGAGGEVDERVIFACARVKLAIVAADERDGGRRQVLNLGHTIGHAIETATGYARYRHGEAVGLGLLAALSLSGQIQLREQVRDLMLARGLPVALDEDFDDEGSRAAILRAMGRDKKRVGESLPFVLVRAPGEVEHGCELPAQAVEAAVEELTRR
jgi:shikimate kinase / 3-dehydroquinate synthase